MKELVKDPIIENYVRLSQCSQTGSEMPIFSETLLRIAFKQIFGKFRRLAPHELSMYRKLLLYYYSEDYPKINDLLLIMTCYNEEEINEAVDECNEVLAEWRTFTTEHLYDDAQRQTFIKILEEWSRRHQRLYGKVTRLEFEDKSAALSAQLNWNLKDIKSLNKMRATILKVAPQTERFPKHLTEEDLNLSNIIKDLLPKINPLLREQLTLKISKETSHNNADNGSVDDDSDDDNEVLANKKLRLEKIEILQTQYKNKEEPAGPSKSATKLINSNKNKKVTKKKPFVEIVNEVNLKLGNEDPLKLTRAAVKNNTKNQREENIKKAREQEMEIQKQNAMEEELKEEEEQAERFKQMQKEGKKAKKLKELQKEEDELEHQKRLKRIQLMKKKLKEHKANGTWHRPPMQIDDDDDDDEVEMFAVYTESESDDQADNVVILNNFMTIEEEAEEEGIIIAEAPNSSGLQIELNTQEYDEGLPIDIIDMSTAKKHISELQTYALINGNFEANELLLRVNDLLISNTHMQDMIEN